MTSSKAKEDIIDLEFALCAKLRPTFLAISSEDEDGDIEIIISCNQFSNKSIQERTSIVFNLISEYVPVILEEHLLIIQTYDNKEMDLVLDDIFSRELF